MAEKQVEQLSVIVDEVGELTGSTGVSSSLFNNHIQKKQHDFKKFYFTAPTWCSACQRFLYGVLSKQGYRCCLCKDPKSALCPKCVKKPDLQFGCTHTSYSSLPTSFSAPSPLCATPPTSSPLAATSIATSLTGVDVPSSSTHRDSPRLHKSDKIPSPTPTTPGHGGEDSSPPSQKENLNRTPSFKTLASINALASSPAAMQQASKRAQMTLIEQARTRTPSNSNLAGSSHTQPGLGSRGERELKTSSSSLKGSLLPVLGLHNSPKDKDKDKERDDVSPTTSNRESIGRRGSPRMKAQMHNVASSLEEITSDSEEAEQVYEWGLDELKFHLIHRLFDDIPIIQVAASGTHLAALGGHGEVFTWGKGTVGQLGFGESTTVIKEPRFLESLDALFQADMMIGDKRYLKNLVCGPTTTAVIDSDGNCYVWGDTQAGTICFYPTTFLPLQGKKVQQLVFSSTHGAALVAFDSNDKRHSVDRVSGEGGEVWTWGKKGPLLGQGRMSENSISVVSPARVEGLQNEEVVSIDTSDSHMLALTARGVIYAWGYNRVNPEAEAKDVKKGAGKRISFKESDLGGKRKSLPDSGLLATGDFENCIYQPKPIEESSDKKIVQVACGSFFSLALTHSGELYSWGCGSNGRLGNGALRDAYQMSLIESISMKNVLRICTYKKTSFAWTDANELFAWGDGCAYRLAKNVSEDSPILTPTIVEPVMKMLGEERMLYQIAMNDFASLAYHGVAKIGVRHNDEQETFLVHSHATLREVEEKVAKKWSLEPGSFTLISDVEFRDGRSVRKAIARRCISGSSFPFFYITKKISPSEIASYDLLFKQGSEGTDELVIKAASLERLIEWLTYPKFVGIRFMSIFLLTYRTIPGMTPLQLMKMLIDRYSNATTIMDPALPDRVREAEEMKFKHSVRIRVLAVIQKWLSSYPSDFLNESLESQALIQVLLDFLEEGGPMTGFSEKATKIRHFVLFQLMGSHRRFKPVAIKDSFIEVGPALHSDPIDLFKYPPKDFASQLTLIEFSQFFQRLEPHEFLSTNWSKKNSATLAPNILRMIQRFNNISQWAAAEILRARNPAERSRVTEILIEISQELYLQRNYNTLMAIQSALHSTPVFRLKCLFQDKKKGISAKHLYLFQELTDLMSPDMNSKKYREDFNKAPPPKIPFLGLVLNQLTYMEEEDNWITRENDGEKLINFLKRTKVAETILQVIDLQLFEYQIRKHPEIFTYLYQARGFENHDYVALAFSKSIQKPTAQSMIGHAPQMTEAPQLIPIPPEYSSAAKTALVDVEVTLLNAQARVGTIRTLDRKRLWSDWLYRLVKSKVQIPTTPVLSRMMSSQINFVSIVENQRSEKSFREVFLQSNALEISVSSILKKFPGDQSEVELFHQLLSASLKPNLLNITSYIEGLRMLSELELTPSHHSAIISQTITIYKNLSRYQFNSENEMKALTTEIQNRKVKLMSNKEKILKAKSTHSSQSDEIAKDIFSESVETAVWVKEKRKAILADIDLYQCVVDSIEVDKMQTLVDHITNLKFNTKRKKVETKLEKLQERKRELERELALVNAGIAGLEEQLKVYENNKKDPETRREMVKNDYIVGYIQTTHAPLVSSTIQQQERVKAIANLLNGLYELSLDTSISAQMSRIRAITGSLARPKTHLSSVLADLEHDKAVLQEAVYSFDDSSPLAQDITSLDDLIQEVRANTEKSEPLETGAGTTEH